MNLNLNLNPIPTTVQTFRLRHSQIDARGDVDEIMHDYQAINARVGHGEYDISESLDFVGNPHGDDYENFYED